MMPKQAVQSEIYIVMLQIIRRLSNISHIHSLPLLPTFSLWTEIRAAASDMFLVQLQKQTNVHYSLLLKLKKSNILKHSRGLMDNSFKEQPPYLGAVNIPQTQTNLTHSDSFKF